MYALAPPSSSKNAAEIDDPIMPPTYENASNLDEMAAADAATTIEVTMTMLT